jgi:hemolysin activation/secretion protein
LSILNALQDPDNLPDSAPHAQFTKWTAAANWMRPFQIGQQNFTFTTAINGQLGVDVLYGSEQFFIGSLYSVRGYRNSSIAGDSGYYWRNDIAAPFQVEAGNMPINLKPYLAYDLGYIGDRNADRGGRLTGMAAGLQASFKKVSMDIFCVKPLTMPETMKDEGLQVFAKLAVNF